MINKQKIYSIQTESNDTKLIEVEVIILNGLYRFSILGINQKNSTDTKDRIYSALRSQKLVNLKSDNKKITVNLLPTSIEKKTNIYDLSIAISCLSCMGQINIDEDIIAIGELSILGNIIPASFVLKSIYQAIKNNVKLIICSQTDLHILNKYQIDIYKIIKDNNIKFISSNNLSDLIQNIKNKTYYVFKDTDTKDIIGFNLNIDHISEKFNPHILKIILALSTKRNIFIENNKNCYIKKYIKNLKYYNIKLNSLEILEISNILNIPDEQILEKYIYPKISELDSQTQKKHLRILLNESTFGFNIIEDFLNINDESLYIIKKFNKSSIFCFYNSCPCGNNNIFFNNIGNNKCFCIQRNIIKHRQKIQNIENEFFDFYISNTIETVTEYISDDYLMVNGIIYKFRNSILEINEGDVSDIFIKNNINNFERIYLDKIISLAKDITKLNCILGRLDITVSQDDIDLAIKLSRKDF